MLNSRKTYIELQINQWLLLAPDIIIVWLKSLQVLIFHRFQHTNKKIESFKHPNGAFKSSRREVKIIKKKNQGNKGGLRRLARVQIGPCNRRSRKVPASRSWRSYRRYKKRASPALRRRPTPGSTLSSTRGRCAPRGSASPWDPAPPSGTPSPAQGSIGIRFRSLEEKSRRLRCRASACG